MGAQKKERRFFASARERYLWLWAAVVVLTIYGTLALRRTLVEFLREEALLGLGFVCGMVLIGVGVLLLALRVRPRGIEIGVAISVMAVYLMVMLRMAIPEERSHLIEYSVVAALIYAALTERASQGRHVPVPALLAVLITTLVGTVDEGIQWLLPNRYFNLYDILFNLLAAVMAVTASVMMGWARRWRAERGT